jgi:GTP-binding protein HflX
LFSDTVGFIQKLPTELVAAFRATLEEINEADVILHIVDITHPNARQQSDTVMNTLADLGADDRPIIWAMNKIDRLADPADASTVLNHIEGAVPISAEAGTGLDDLLCRVDEVLSAELVYVTVQVPFDRGDLTGLFHDQGTVVKASHDSRGTVLEGYLPRRLLERFRAYWI